MSRIIIVAVVCGLFTLNLLAQNPVLNGNLKGYLKIKFSINH